MSKNTTTTLQREFNRLFGNTTSRPQPKSQWIIQWDDGHTTQVFKRGRYWNWGGNESSHLDGIRDQLNYDRKAGRPSGNLVRVKV